MLYRFTRYDTEGEDIKVEGHILKVGRALFIESDTDFVKKYKGNDSIAVVNQDGRELPEFNMFGEKIVIHKV